MFSEGSCPALKNWPGFENSEAAALRRLTQCRRPHRVLPLQPRLKHFINLPECCLLVNDSRGGSVLRNISSCFPAVIAPLQAVGAIMKSHQRHFITPPLKLRGREVCEAAVRLSGHTSSNFGRPGCEKIEGNYFPSSLEVSKKKLCVLERSSPVTVRRRSLSSVKS